MKEMKRVGVVLTEQVICRSCKVNVNSGHMLIMGRDR